jgi:hypothetical protein
MTTDSRTTLARLREHMSIAVYPGASTYEQHKFAIEFVCAEIDAIKAKLPKDTTPTDEDFAR